MTQAAGNAVAARGEAAHRSFTLGGEAGRTIRGDIDTPAGVVVGRCILLPAFGLTKLDLLVMAYYLLVNGFEVVRFDPTCHVGDSDGDVGDFRLGTLACDVERVAAHHADADTAVVGISLSSRAAFRALAGVDLKGLFLLAPVVHTRQTLFEVCGEDLIGQHLEGSAPEAYSILDMMVARAFCEDCVAGRFDSLASTQDDARRVAAPTCLVVGSQDRWVAPEDVAQVADVMPACRLITLDGANHQMFRSPVMFQAYLAVLLQELRSAYGQVGEPVLPRFAEVVRYVNAAKRQRRDAEALCD